MDKEIIRLAEEMQALSNEAVLQYTNIVDNVLNGKITDVQEIE